MKLFLWKLSQDENNEYDTYDSAIVVSRGHSAATMIHPARCLDTGGAMFGWNGSTWFWVGDGSPASNLSWVTPNEVKAVLVGEATAGILAEGDVVCASYNAG